MTNFKDLKAPDYIYQNPDEKNPKNRTYNPAALLCYLQNIFIPQVESRTTFTYTQNDYDSLTRGSMEFLREINNRDNFILANKKEVARKVKINGKTVIIPAELIKPYSDAVSRICSFAKPYYNEDYWKDYSPYATSGN